MFSIRKWIFRPKRSDTSLLAQFFYVDEELNMVAAELDSFDGRKDPERCTALVNQLRICQDKVLSIIESIMQEVIPGQRAPRDFRVKFPDDVLQENLAGQLWFGAECLAAGSSIMNREVESASMRPLAKALTKHLDFLRTTLRDQCLKNLNIYNDTIREALMVFDKLFAEFELSYVSAMVPVKTMKEYEMVQDVVVLFCETVNRAMRLKLLTQDMIDDYDPALMFTIPRLAIVCGLLVFPEGPLNPDMDPMSMSEMFRPFQTLLYKIRELLWTLSKQELWLLEKSLCSAEEPGLYRDLQPLQLEEGLDQSDAMESGHPYDDSLRGPKIVEKEGKVDVGAEHSSLGAGSGFLGAEGDLDYRMMTHSSSTITVVAAGGSCNSSQDDISVPRAKRNTVLSSSELEQELQLEREQIRRCMNQKKLCHSRSWPDGENPIRVARRHQSEGSVNGPEDRSSDGLNAMHPYRAINFEFEFNLPLNTERSGQNEGEVSSQRFIFMNPKCDDMEDSASSTGESMHQVSFVTDTLNEVFVTDSAFQEAVIRSDAVPSNSCDKISKKCSSSKGPGPSCDADGSSEVAAEVEQSDPRTKLQISPNHFEDKSEGEALEKHAKQKQTTSVSSKSTNNKLNIQQDQNESDRCPKEQEQSRKGSFSARFAGDEKVMSADCLDVPKIQKVKSAGSVTAAMVRSHSPGAVEYDWDRESYCSSDTSSYNSESNDDEEIALAIQAAELTARREARARFRSSADLIHRLFVCVSGVADQLQTNYASDLRNILKVVFECYASEPVLDLEAAELAKETADTEEASPTHQSSSSSSEEEEEPQPESGDLVSRAHEEAPAWVPDDESPHCSACKVPFTFVRRRHHCRNCGKIFCSRCSSNSVPLPHYGHSKPVRVCNHCFVFQVTPFTVDE